VTTTAPLPASAVDVDVDVASTLVPTGAGGDGAVIDTCAALGSGRADAATEGLESSTRFVRNITSTPSTTTTATPSAAGNARSGTTRSIRRFIRASTRVRSFTLRGGGTLSIVCGSGVRASGVDG
jgi:hypothetical protein